MHVVSWFSSLLSFDFENIDVFPKFSKELLHKKSNKYHPRTISAMNSLLKDNDNLFEDNISSHRLCLVTDPSIYFFKLDKAANDVIEKCKGAVNDDEIVKDKVKAQLIHSFREEDGEFSVKKAVKFYKTNYPLKIEEIDEDNALRLFKRITPPVVRDLISKSSEFKKKTWLEKYRLVHGKEFDDGRVGKIVAAVQQQDPDWNKLSLAEQLNKLVIQVENKSPDHDPNAENSPSPSYSAPLYAGPYIRSAKRIESELQYRTTYSTPYITVHHRVQQHSTVYSTTVS